MTYTGTNVAHDFGKESAIRVREIQSPTGSVIIDTQNGISIAGSLTLGANEDIVFTGTTGTNDVTLTNGLADALSVTDGAADVIAIDTSTAGNVITVTAATAQTGQHVVTATTANALAVGRQGSTAPVLKVDASTASVATGVSITGAAAAGGVAVAAISSGTDESLTVDAKGAGVVKVATVSTGGFQVGTNATDVLTIKGIYASPANVAVTVPAITDPDIAKVDVDVSTAFAIQPAVGDYVIAAPQEAMEANARILGCYVTATDQITLVFGSEGGNVTGGSKNFKFLVVDVT